MTDLRADLHTAIYAELDGDRREIALRAADKAFDESAGMAVAPGLRHCIRAIAEALAAS